MSYAENLRRLDRQRELLQWLQARLAPFQVEATDLGDSFKDPRVISGLIKSFLPSLVDLEGLAEDDWENQVARVTGALTSMERKLKIQRTQPAETLLTQPDSVCVQAYVAACQAHEYKQELLTWVNEKITASGQDVPTIKNFDQHMSDGKVMVALVNAFKPDSVALNKVNDNTKQAYVSKAFIVAEQELGVAPLLGASSLCGNPDATTVQRFCLCFESLNH